MLFTEAYLVVPSLKTRYTARMPAVKSTQKKNTSPKPRKRRTYEEIFLDELRKIGAGNAVGNTKLRKQLDWEEDKYWHVHSQLRQRGAIVVGTGKGGSVKAADGKSSKGVSLFVSYSHADESLKVELLKHLEPLRKLGLIETWHDRKISAGGDWAGEISKNLESADIVLILVSIDFINSKYCYDIELDRALERHSSGEAVVVPVILRRCLWANTPLAAIQALPTDGKAVTMWQDRDEAMVVVAEGIRRVAEQRRVSS